MKTISDELSDWDSEHIARIDARHRFRLAYRRKGWKRTSTKYLYFESFKKAWEFREKLLANDLGYSPIEFLRFELLDRPALDEPTPPRSRRWGQR